MKFWVIAVLLVNSCTITGFSIAENIPEEQGSVNVMMCSQVDCFNVFLDFINDYGEVRCAFYNAGDEIRNLNSSEKQIWVQNKNKRGLMHNKFCVSGTLVLTGSFNPLPKPSFDNLIIVNSSIIATNYGKEFEELVKQGENKKTKNSEVRINNILVENYFCPEDNCKEKVIENLAKANTSILFMTFSFTHPEIAQELVIKYNEGVKVRGLFEKSGNNAYSKHDFLLSQGLDVKMFAEKINIHHKVFIIDNRTVITGSMNPTKAGDTKNDENMLVIHNKEIAKQFVEEFEKLWILK